MKEQEGKITIRQGLRYALREWNIFWKLSPNFFIATFACAALTALSPYATVWLSAQLVGELAGNRDLHRLTTLVLWILGTTAVLTFLRSAAFHWKEAETDDLWRRHNKTYMDKQMSLDYVDEDSQRVYDMYSQIMQNANLSGVGGTICILQVEQIMTALFQILGGIVLSWGLFASAVPDGKLAFLSHPAFVLVFFAVMAGVACLSPVFAGQAAKYMPLVQESGKLGNRMFHIQLSLPEDPKNALDLRIYNQYQNVVSDQMLNVYGSDSTFFRLRRGRMGVLKSASSSVSALLMGFVYLFVCLKACGGAFGLGETAQYLGAATNLFQGLVTLVNMLADLEINGVYMKNIFTYLDLPNNMYQGSLTTEKRSDRQYTVEFRDVSFRYPGSEQYALRHLNMKFKVGERLAVVGMNGSGKTTFIKLLCRLYDPTEGVILLNGIDIRKYRYDEYMDIFSVVFQDFRLLALPLGQNVATRQNYDAARVTDCLNKAGFGERLAKMPQGLETSLYKELDENGVAVSGGEAQKIAIARALYKDAPFIVLDEPTAALDPVAEAEIYAKFNEIAGDKTAIYISHRLSSCKFCDEIAVFDHGEVVQQGTHEALLSDTNGKYCELWNAQAQYYTEETA